MTPVLGLLTPLLFGLAGRALLRASPPLARLPWPTRAAYSYLLGVAAVAGTLFLGSHLFGVPIDRDVSRVVFAVWIVAGAVVARRRPALSPRPFLGRRPGARRAVLAWSALVAALGASVLLDSLVNPIIDWDGRITWTAHARYVASAGTVDAPALAEPAWLVAHPQYPLLLPLAQVAIQETLESSDERTMRPLYATFLPVFLVLILDAGRRWGGTLAGVGASGMVAVVPWIAFNPDGGALGAYSDLPLACLFGGGLILLLSPAGWRGVALPAGVLLGGAALAKNEGMALALAALAGGAVHWLLQRRAPRRSGHLLLRLLGTAACVAVALGAHWSWSRGIAQRYDEGYATLLLGGEFFRNLAVQLPDTLAQGFLIMSSPPWATLWGAVGALLLLGAAGLRRRPVAPFAAALVGGAAAFLLVYSSGTWPE